MKELPEICRRNSWDESAITAVISLETGGTMAPDAGIDRWTPTWTATGLLQWTEGTLRTLDVPPTGLAPRERLKQFGGKWRTWNLAGFGVCDQLRLLERFYSRAFQRKGPTRPVDYYLVPWGAAPGLPLGTVLSVKGDGIYEQNQSLDYDSDGKIQVKDLARLVRNRMAELEKSKAQSASLVIPSPVTLPGVLLTVGFGVIRRRMMLGM